MNKVYKHNLVKHPEANLRSNESDGNYDSLNYLLRQSEERARRDLLSNGYFILF
jgi:hypothetical protein